MTPEEQAQVAAFARALNEELAASGIEKPRTWLRTKFNLTDQAISNWLTGRSTPKPDRVFELEQVLNLPPGRLSRHLGYLPASAVEVTSVLEAIDNDPLLTNLQVREMVKLAYEAAVKVSGRNNGNPPAVRR